MKHCLFWLANIEFERGVRRFCTDGGAENWVPRPTGIGCGKPDGEGVTSSVTLEQYQVFLDSSKIKKKYM